jgi:hypothetical protein
MRARTYLTGLCLLAALALHARADIPVPGETPEQAAARRARWNQERLGIFPPPLPPSTVAPPSPPSTVPLTIKGIGFLGDARLVLPRKVLANLQASFNPGAGAAGGGGSVRFDLRTAVAGIALSLVAVWVGLRVARSRRRLALAGLGGLMVCLVVLGTGCPPREQVRPDDSYRLTPLAKTADGRLAGEVLVALGDGDEVALEVSRETMSQFLVGSGLKTEFAP